MTLYKIKSGVAYGDSSGFTASYCKPMTTGAGTNSNPEKSCKEVFGTDASTMKFCKECKDETSFALLK